MFNNIHQKWCLGSRLYKNWHDYKYHHHIHIGVLLTYILSLTFKVYLIMSISLTGVNKAFASIDSPTFIPGSSTVSVPISTSPMSASCTYNGSNCTDTQDAVYSLDGLYNITDSSATTSCTTTSDTPPFWFNLYYSTDNITYNTLFDNSSCFTNTGSHPSNVNARYVKINVYVNTAVLSGLGFPTHPQIGTTYSSTVSAFTLTGTSLGSHRLNHHPSG